jgi:hypothetical protein
LSLGLDVSFAELGQSDSVPTPDHELCQVDPVNSARGHHAAVSVSVTLFTDELFTVSQLRQHLCSFSTTLPYLAGAIAGLVSLRSIDPVQTDLEVAYLQRVTISHGSWAADVDLRLRRYGSASGDNKQRPLHDVSY